MFRRFQFIITSSLPSSSFRFHSSSSSVASLETIQSQIKTVENDIVEAQLKFNNANKNNNNSNSSSQRNHHQHFFPIGILTSTKNKMAEFDNIMSKLEDTTRTSTMGNDEKNNNDENIV